MALVIRNPPNQRLFAKDYAAAAYRAERQGFHTLEIHEPDRAVLCWAMRAAAMSGRSTGITDIYVILRKDSQNDLGEADTIALFLRCAPAIDHGVRRIQLQVCGRRAGECQDACDAANAFFQDIIDTRRRRRLAGLLRSIVVWLIPARKRACERCFSPEKLRREGYFNIISS